MWKRWRGTAWCIMHENGPIIYEPILVYHSKCMHPNWGELYIHIFMLYKLEIVFEKPVLIANIVHINQWDINFPKVSKLDDPVR